MYVYRQCNPKVMISNLVIVNSRALSTVVHNNKIGWNQEADGYAVTSNED